MKAPSEKHLEDWIVDNVSKFYRGTHPANVPMVEKLIARQFTLPHGIVDLIGVRRNHLCVIELKKDVIDYATICQCMRYMHQIQRIAQEQYSALSAANNYQPIGFEAYVSGIVVGYKFASKDIVMIANALRIYPMLYEYLDNEQRYEFDDYDDYEEQKDLYYVDQSIWEDYLYGVLGEAMRNFPREEVDS